VIGIVAVVLLVATGCASPPTAQATIGGRLVSGPHCPVETSPPDPACAPRPVAGATILGESDHRQIETVSGSDGGFVLVVPAGSVTITFAPVAGLMGTPAPITLVVAADEERDLGEISYDTGIR
jgi:hypothetical protein